jgi:hypothetical protein
MEEESMSYPGFVRPDLCSIRTAGEQDELAEATRSGLSAAGPHWAMMTRLHP